MSKIELSGDLFVLIEEDSVNGTDVTVEVGGINIFQWLEEHNEEKIKVTLELLE